MKRHLVGPLGIVLVALIAVLLSGCDARLCDQPADNKFDALWQGFVCLGYHAPNAVEPSFEMLTSVNGRPVPVTTDIQSGSVVQFDATSSHILPPYDQSDFIASYEWEFEGDGNFVTGDANGKAAHTYQAATTRQVKVTLRVTDELGATATVTRWLTIAPRTLTASFTSAPLVPDPNQNVVFDVTSVDPAGQIDHSWNFGDGSTADGGPARTTTPRVHVHRAGQRHADDPRRGRPDRHRVTAG